MILCKIMRSSHKHPIMKNQIQEEILAIKSCMDYSPIIIFKNTIVNVNKSIALTNTNQLEKFNGEKWFWHGSTNHLMISSKCLPL